MQSVRDVLRQREMVQRIVRMNMMQSVRDVLRQRSAPLDFISIIQMQSVRDVLRQSKGVANTGLGFSDAIRAGCSETNGRSLYSNDHAQNNEVNRKES